MDFGQASTCLRWVVISMSKVSGFWVPLNDRRLSRTIYTCICIYMYKDTYARTCFANFLTVYDQPYLVVARRELSPRDVRGTV